MSHMPDKEFPVERTAMIGGVVLIDPHTKKPYKSGVTVQQVEGGFDPTGLSTEQKQDAILAALQELIDAFQATDAQEVVITDDQLPPVEGQATATKQDQILTALNTLASLATEAATFRDSGVQAVSLESTPLPVGAASAAKQDQVLVALASLAEALSGTLNVAGTVALDPDEVTVSGQVAITNTSVPVTPAPGATYPVTLAGSATEAKQDAMLMALGNLLTQVQAPQPITDNGGSVTVDGTVGVSGAVQVEDNGKSLTVDGLVDAKQNGTWNVGITGTPTVNVGNTVTISDGSGPLTVDGTVTVGNTSIPVTQSGTWSMNVTSSPSSTSPALTAYRNVALSSTPQQIKSGAGRIYQYSFHNPNNVPVYIHVWGLLAANVTPGTTVPLVTIGVPAGSVLDGYWTVSPASFPSGITVSASTSSSGTGAPTTGVLTQLGYV